MSTSIISMAIPRGEEMIAILEQSVAEAKGDLDDAMNDPHSSSIELAQVSALYENLKDRLRKAKYLENNT